MLLNLLLVLEIIVAFFLIVVVLLQRSEGGALGMGGGPSGFMTARGAGDLLTRTTWILGTTFFVLGLLLTIVAGRERGTASVVDRLKVNAINPTELQREAQPAAPSGQPQQPQAPAPSPFEAPTPTINSPFGQLPAQGAPPAAPAPAAPAKK
jgi:preprotein translocase subunit SecG